MRERQAREFRDAGFIALEAAVPLELCQRVRDEVGPLIGDQVRAQDVWRSSDAVRELAGLSSIVDVIRSLYGREPFPFQTLNFQYGTQQEPHSDVVHFNSLPSRFMCGVWVALEEVDADNGPLFYYPGSHRLRDPVFQQLGLPAGLSSYSRYAMVQQALVEAAGYERQEFHAEAGDVLIWAANLVHGGQPIRDAGRTRWSQVTHYFFADCVYVTPLLSIPDVGEWYVRSDLRDVRSGELVDHSYDGDPVSFEPLGDGICRVHVGTHHQRAMDALSDRLAAAEAEARALRTSASFRVGRALLGPLAWLPRWRTRRRDRS